jgi:hypothetical protein
MPMVASQSQNFKCLWFVKNPFLHKGWLDNMILENQTSAEKH